MSNTPKTSTFYVVGLGGSYGANANATQTLGPADSAYARVLAGVVSQPTEVAYMTMTFDTNPTIPKFSKITSVLLETHPLGWSYQNKDLGPFIDWGFNLPSRGGSQWQLGSYTVPNQNAFNDLGVVAYNVTAYPPGGFNREDLSTIYTYSRANADGNNVNEVEHYWDYWKLTVTWIHPPEVRMVV